MGERVILTGFMGVGKTASGRHLAELLGWRFVDLDEEVERAAGRSVAEIFADEGEARFRERETKALERVLRRRRVVVATGGGVLLKEENRRRLSGHLVVNLSASPTECLRRVRGSATERPLLAGDDPEGRARSLLAAREPLYRAVPRQVDTEGKSAAAVAREIWDRFLPPGGPGEGGAEDP